ncbi:hypothetical protein ACT3CD_15195 [Geofilum sp. OHC36d9]|uniref:hypothetical protein n=1 Tax=Geofilum sp. OHC36d9 TaxID=3458413 RepID=UPI0040349B28
MKRCLFILPILLFTATLINAQEKCSKEEQLERINAQKVAFFTKKTGMTSGTAQKFWPVYNEYSSKKDSLYQLKKTIQHRLYEKKATLTNQQKDESLNMIIRLKIESAETEQQYHQKFKKILSIDQIILLYEAEHEFKMRLFKQMKEAKKQYKKKDNDSSQS